MDTVTCISVNDASVMQAWKKDLNIRDEVLLLSDGNREFTLALGVELDLPDKPMGLGIRSQRYALLAEDGVVKVLNLDTIALLGPLIVTILTDRNGQPKGFAYVEFLEVEAVQEAFWLHESELHGRPIKVAAKRTNVPGLKQFHPLRHNPYPMYSYSRPHMPS
ncbi:hypothetical protein ZIOFF_001539 [Zingiber officinale]|uniref:glutaredoxin-dependent peroxiredoxin n=1 Tax=Zingiber officinale TaxID=94328 RepID=A0A8J5I3L4_ZINOF|nr:hypothetical protein ZIOFF_001539 [Zingiber officinale]